MALIVITLRDREGGVDVHLADEPRVDPDQTEFTPAQQLGAAALNAIHSMLASDKMNRPRLVIVGADELPN
jgi:hypothetical protein